MTSLSTEAVTLNFSHAHSVHACSQLKIVTKKCLLYSLQRYECLLHSAELQSAILASELNRDLWTCGSIQQLGEKATEKKNELSSS
jgi:hypothetical protein